MHGSPRRQREGLLSTVARSASERGRPTRWRFGLRSILPISARSAHWAPPALPYSRAARYRDRWDGASAVPVGHLPGQHESRHDFP